MTFAIDVEDDGSPQAALDLAGQSVRAFNRRSSPRFWPQQAGWRYPSDAYSALGELTYLTGCLPQVFQHIIGALRCQLEQGHIRIDPGTEYASHPETTVNAARVALDRATLSAHQMYEAIAAAQVAIARAAYCGPDLEED
jgi:hypothetical protein